MSVHLREAWRRLATDERLQRAVDNALQVVDIDLDAQSYAASTVLKWRDQRTWGEAIETAMKVWRSGFVESSNMRAYLEGRGMAPAYQRDWSLVFYSEVIKEEMKSPLGSETWRIEMGQHPMGATVHWPIKAVAAARSGALEFEMTLISHDYGVSLYRVPGSAHGVWFPDRREAIVSGTFRVTDVKEVEKGIMEVTLS